MSEHVDLREFLSGYLAEADEHLASVRSNLLAADEATGRGEAAPRAVRELFRSLHTIKGLSGMVGVEPVVEIAHAMEAVLRTADRAGGRLPPGAADVLARGARSIEERVRALSADEPVAPANKALLDAIGAIHPAGEPRAAGVSLNLPEDLEGRLSPGELAQISEALGARRKVLRLDFVPTPERSERGVNITSVREAVGRLGDIVKVVPLSVPRTEGAPGGLFFSLLVITDAGAADLAGAADSTPESVSELSAVPSGETGWEDEEPEGEESEATGAGTLRRGAGVVRVEVARLDDALEKLSGLVVSRYRLDRAVGELTAAGADTRALRESLDETARQLRDLRAAIMRSRMVRVAEVLDRVPLLVRGMSRSTGKPVKLKLDAGRAEVDKAVADRLFPAVIHLVRNAIDHAIEPAEERRQAGKPEEGRVTVTCFERSDSQLELVVADDGRGIDRQQVARRAGRPVPRSEAELLELLALPGLSTRDQATATSGRGYGVDIVRRIAVNQLGGELHLATSEGRGSRFTLRVPLSLTIVEALLLVCADEPFVVPVTAVEEIVEVEASGMIRAPRVSGTGPAVGLLRRRGEAMPLVSLDGSLGARSDGTARRKALVIRLGGQPFAFGIDRLIGQQEVVVRPLEDPLVRVPGVTGSTDLGDGRPTLVLDLVALAARVSAGEARPS